MDLPEDDPKRVKPEGDHDKTGLPIQPEAADSPTDNLYKKTRLAKNQCPLNGLIINQTLSEFKPKDTGRCLSTASQGGRVPRPIDGGAMPLRAFDS